uniref:Uncharacterized protein n=1 Tax=Anguilla anguilla TaxID=7936 RepID=A0A0E9VGZ1_ANGAN
MAIYRGAKCVRNWIPIRVRRAGDCVDESSRTTALLPLYTQISKENLKSSKKASATSGSIAHRVHICS